MLSIIGYGDDEDAISIANDTPYGLAAYVHGVDHGRVSGVAARLRAGTVCVNGAPLDATALFGGYKHSGNGREGGVFGFANFLELKAVLLPRRLS